MDFQLSDDQELIRTAVRKICADYPDEYWAEKDEARLYHEKTVQEKFPAASYAKTSEMAISTHRNMAIGLLVKKIDRLP